MTTTATAAVTTSTATRTTITPSIRQWSEWVSTGSSLLLRVEESTGKLVHLPILPHLVKLLQVVHQINAWTLPSCSPRVMVDIVHSTMWVHTTLPANTRTEYYYQYYYYYYYYYYLYYYYKLYECYDRRSQLKPIHTLTKLEKMSIALV